MEKYLQKAPCDEDGFVKAFGVDEVNSYLEFFEEYGFVVIKDVLSPGEYQATVNEVWRDIEAMPSFEGPIKRDDPSTWGNERWPQKQQLGILGSFPCVGPEALKNRQNERVYDVYRNILKSDKLLVTFDRYGILRPAKNYPDRKTIKDWVHWDLNPWTFKSSTIYFSTTEFAPGRRFNRNILKVQGLISLVDCRPEDGGFHTVPKFSKYCFEDWAKENEGSEHHSKFKEASFVPVPKNDNLFYGNLQPVPMRAGSLLVWNSKQPHGNYPNNSDSFRICQYVKMISLEHFEDEKLKRDLQGDPKFLVPPTFGVSELGEKLFSLKPWESERKSPNPTTITAMTIGVIVVALVLYYVLK